MQAVVAVVGGVLFREVLVALEEAALEALELLPLLLLPPDQQEPLILAGAVVAETSKDCQMQAAQAAPASLSSR